MEELEHQRYQKIENYSLRILEITLNISQMRHEPNKRISLSINACGPCTWDYRCDAED